MVSTRYNFIKKIYPNYVIFIYKDGKYYTFKNDRLVIKNIINKDILNEKDIKVLNNIYYIILDNLKIVKKFENAKNNYYLFLKRQKLIEMLKI